MQQSQVAMEEGSSGAVCSILNMKPRKNLWSQTLSFGAVCFSLIWPVEKTQPWLQDRVDAVMLLYWRLLRSNTPQRIGPVLPCWPWNDESYLYSSFSWAKPEMSSQGEAHLICGPVQEEPGLKQWEFNLSIGLNSYIHTFSNKMNAKGTWLVRSQPS